MSDRYGYQNFTGTGLSEEILASKENLVELSVTIDTTCRDTANSPTTQLRRGLLLFPDPTVSGRYTQFDAAAHTAALDDEVVVLAHPIVDMSLGNVVAKVYAAGVFKSNKLIDDSGYTLTHWDKSLAQRIVIMANL